MTMTTRPTSHLIHSGFLDILSLIPESTSIPSRDNGRAPEPPKKTEDDLRQILRDHAQASPKKGKVMHHNDRERKKDNRQSMEVGLRKRKIDKAIIGPPMDFRYVPPARLLRLLSGFPSCVHGNPPNVCSPRVPSIA